MSDKTSDATGPALRPRYGRFIGTGVVVGVLIAIVLTVFRPHSAAYSGGQVVLYLGLVFALVGALLGGGVAVWLESRADRRARPTRPRDDEAAPRST